VPSKHALLLMIYDVFDLRRILSIGKAIKRVSILFLGNIVAYRGSRLATSTVTCLIHGGKGEKLDVTTAAFR